MMANFSGPSNGDFATPSGNSSTFGPTTFQIPQANPLVVRQATPLPARAAKPKVSQNPFLLDPVQISKKNPFVIPLLPNPDLFGINIPT